MTLKKQVPNALMDQQLGYISQKVTELVEIRLYSIC
jgi:hypothetical protein